MQKSKIFLSEKFNKDLQQGKGLPRQRWGEYLHGQCHRWHRRPWRSQVPLACARRYGSGRTMYLSAPGEYYYVDLDKELLTRPISNEAECCTCGSNTSNLIRQMFKTACFYNREMWAYVTTNGINSIDQVRAVRLDKEEIVLMELQWSKPTHADEPNTHSVKVECWIIANLVCLQGQISYTHDELRRHHYSETDR